MPRCAVLFLLFVCLLFAVIGPVKSGFEKFCKSENERIGGHRDGICGKELSYVIEIVCKGEFSQMKKRSEKSNAKAEEGMW